MKKLVIIPAYNEEKNILNVCNMLIKKNLDYIIINDGSFDDTEKVCIENNLNYITLISNLGIGGAVQTGYKYAYENNYDLAIQFDGDGQHDVEYISKLCFEIENSNCDLCIGSRYIDNTSKFKSTFMRRIGKNILSILIKIFTFTKITDPTSGFRACNKKTIELFCKIYPIDYPEPETIIDVLKSGLKIKEIPVNMNERKEGKSSITLFKSAYYMIRVCLAISIYSLTFKKVVSK